MPRTELHIAVGCFYLAAVQRLLEAVVDVTIEDEEGESPLHVAALTVTGFSSAAIVKLLVQAGAELNCRNIHEETPLLFAAQECNLPLAKVLLEAGAEVNCRNDRGSTPLVYAAATRPWNRIPAMIKLLLEAGANANLRDRGGLSPLDHALHPEEVFLAAVKLLLEAGADLNLRDKAGGSALNSASNSSSAAMILELLLRVENRDLVEVGLLSVLQDRVRAMESEREELMKDDMTCKICMDAKVSIAILPCGHLNCCQTCAHNSTVVTLLRWMKRRQCSEYKKSPRKPLKFLSSPFKKSLRKPLGFLSSPPLLRNFHASLWSSCLVFPFQEISTQASRILVFPCQETLRKPLEHVLTPRQLMS